MQPRLHNAEHQHNLLEIRNFLCLVSRFSRLISRGIGLTLLQSVAHIIHVIILSLWETTYVNTCNIRKTSRPTALTPVAGLFFSGKQRKISRFSKQRQFPSFAKYCCNISINLHFISANRGKSRDFKWGLYFARFSSKRAVQTFERNISWLNIEVEALGIYSTGTRHS